jgi:hypothetical protein
MIALLAVWLGFNALVALVLWLVHRHDEPTFDWRDR